MHAYGYWLIICVNMLNIILLLLFLLLFFSATEQLSELKTYELNTSKVLTVCQQLVLTAFRYPNLSETTNASKKRRTYPSTTRTRITGHSTSSQAPHLVFIQEGWVCFPFSTYIIPNMLAWSNYFTSSIPLPYRNRQWINLILHT